MSNMALRRFINGAFREEEMTLLMAVPTFCAEFETIATFDEAEALIEIGNRLLVEGERNGPLPYGDAQSL